jgi:hypothetical protein
MVNYGGASFVSFSPPKRGEGRDEGFCLTFIGVISSLHRNEILRLPITLNRTLILAASRNCFAAPQSFLFFFANCLQHHD